ncbi:hypothetical protein CAI21_03360 [Alkalilimnicola ehrlichii]|uniref:Polymer-forming cytoskeletal protein n=1 Tax=Alkalilimnicola ehrlichii TaxID=351052 RepID=A0A3E0X3E5_9GAMM|nr:polymer-forming cytoskeletal protein [Alkalilimnicola ehrlichii]RFA31023.1 hypothetical protein CAI21_03360 [Alkalilimnicola ehrlichii]RFA38976.1 hypothetical protein CAL65_03510 [Alkalilimnicola ehrlichii]
MGFLRKRNDGENVNLGTTVISQGTKFVGELTLDAKLHIDGHFEGNVTSSNDVSIGSTGHFEGTIVAKNMLVSGYARGKFECDCLEIIETGRVFGDVVSEDFVIESGGRFVGGSRSRGDEPVPQLSHSGQGKDTASEKADKPEDKAKAQAGARAAAAKKDERAEEEKAEVSSF